LETTDITDLIPVITDWIDMSLPSQEEEEKEEEEELRFSNF
jgi:hypothetical protein